jgi:intracellular multiplication protein IcmE
MSGTLGRLPFGNPFGRGGVFNRTGHASPVRLLLISGTAIAALGAVVVVSFIGRAEPPLSQTARMPTVNALPGGPHTNPNQDRLALRHDQAEAEAAARRGQSYTPPLAPSHPLNVNLAPIAPGVAPVVTPPAPTAAPAIPIRFVTPSEPRPVPAEVRPIQHVAQTTQGEPREDQLFRAAVADVLNGWGGRPSRTDVVIPATRREVSGPAGEETRAETSAASDRFREDRSPVLPPAPTAARPLPPQVLVPAGRGVYAHTVLAVNSDTGGPIVLQADTGSIAGDRIIGSFGRAGSSDLLVVKVTSVVHNGQSIPVDGVVIAPDTMETAVATSVDQHYLSRFLLPAAAAFIQGLGQAIATTSNTQTVLSPFGGATYSTQLNLDQQVGVGAGVAAARIGNALNQAAPRSATVNLAANASVGIMFLTSVSVPQR